MTLELTLLRYQCSWCALVVLWFSSALAVEVKLELDDLADPLGSDVDMDCSDMSSIKKNYEFKARFVGVDASDQFAAFHRPRVYGRLQQFLVGQVIDDDKHLPSKATADYRALRKRLWREGWFAPDLSFYVNKAIVCVLLFALAIGLVTLEAPTWKLLRTLLAGAVLGIAWQQVAFMAHDADHYGITTPRSGASFNPLAWFLASVLFGISRCMWNEEHSLHHAITLRPQEDPQFNYLPIWLISKKELDVPGTKVDFLTRTLVSVQHYTFLPLSVVMGRFNFYIISMLAALKRLLTAKRFREAYGGLMDVTGMVLFWIWYATLVKQLDASWERVAFVLVSNWTVGILHIQLVLSHLATETFTAEEAHTVRRMALRRRDELIAAHLPPIAAVQEW
ncbi:unnamed protein product [Durusdinium trenchii]|uniref:Fatty acid desaturase domain-containing protein n=1 Tax=Durusdinium trenchii TaxID=1381693 RepID=A0ABP0HMM1_9DINO